MGKVATTRMSSKGQVVIPEDIRKQLRLKPGSRFVVVGDRGIVILKEITPLSMDEFDDLIAEARRSAREAGMRRSDIIREITAVRGRK
jgi:AbrB family looped-hinge helix DNA binding protein